MSSIRVIRGGDVFRIPCNETDTLLALLRQAAQTRGLMILTDSDGAGLVIRNFLRSALPKEGVLHA